MKLSRSHKIGVVAAVKAGLDVALTMAVVRNQGRGITQGKTYQVIGLDSDDDLMVKDDDNDEISLNWDALFNMPTYLLINGEDANPAMLDALAMEEMKLRRQTLGLAYNTFAEKHTFEHGQTIVFKPGMKNRKYPDYGEPVVFLGYRQADKVLDGSNDQDSPYAGDQMDCTIGMLMHINGKDDFILYLADSRRFEPVSE